MCNTGQLRFWGVSKTVLWVGWVGGWHPMFVMGEVGLEDRLVHGVNT